MDQASTPLPPMQNGQPAAQQAVGGASSDAPASISPQVNQANQQAEVPQGQVPQTPPTPTGVPAPPQTPPPMPGQAPPPMAQDGQKPPQKIDEATLLEQKKQALEAAINTSNVPNVVSAVIDYAITSGSSDIHIEPENDQEVRIRIRVDGVLKIVATYQAKVHPAVVSRVKIISNLKIDEQRMPQDGRAPFTSKNPFTQKIIQADLRVSTLPTVAGEKIVMRIQDKGKEIPDFDKLGIKGNNRKYLEEGIAMPNGVMLVSGPTGSGKTTTLYSGLNLLNTDDVNIMTIEDPVEYQMEGLNQSQVHTDIGFDFASGLRTALRQDPDIIMIGEIRDMETIEIAIRAALTGHLVFSTIHTNSAVDTITRILNMGVPGFLIAAAVKMIVAQRLVRRVCPDCREEVQLDKAKMDDALDTLSKIHPSEPLDPELKKNPVFFQGKGCSKCNGSGYKGRIGLYEILMIRDELSEMIVKGATRGEMQYAAMHAGMITLKQSGMIKALEGETTIEEVYRVANSS